MSQDAFKSISEVTMLLWYEAPQQTDYKVDNGANFALRAPAFQAGIHKVSDGSIYSIILVSSVVCRSCAKIDYSETAVQLPVLTWRG
jgi:hypothetical protein